MDWIHCNNCFVQPKAETDIMKFIITNCGHLFCNRCAEKMGGKCVQCSSACRTMAINNNMDPAIAVHFQSLNDYVQRLAALHKEASTLLGSFTKAQMFQDSQRRNLMNYLTRKAEAASGAFGRAEEIEQLQQRIASDKQTIAKLQQEHDRLVTIISNSLHQRPPSSTRQHGNSGNPHNEMSPSVSMVSLAPSNASRTSKSGFPAPRVGSVIKSGSSHRSSLVFQVEPVAAPTQDELREQRNKVVSRMLRPNFQGGHASTTASAQGTKTAAAGISTSTHTGVVLSNWNKRDPQSKPLPPSASKFPDKGAPANSGGTTYAPRLVHAGTATGGISSLRQLGTTSRTASVSSRSTLAGNKFIR